MSNANHRPLFGELLFLLGKVGCIFLIFVCVFTWIYGVFQNEDLGMLPAVNLGDLIVYDRLDKNYYAQDTVALKEKGVYQVRRVVAREGDTVDITEQGLSINGSIQIEPRIYTDTKQFEKGIDFPVTLKKGEIFVLGDCRKQARDSRLYGSVQKADTLGKVILVVRLRNI